MNTELINKIKGLKKFTHPSMPITDVDKQNKAHVYGYNQAIEDVVMLFEAFDFNIESEQLINFLIYLNDKKLINNYDFDYEKEAKKYLKKIRLPLKKN